MDKLECLRIFYRVAETGSFTSIAQEFNLTQPMVSKRISWLEAELGTLLFRRTTRGMSLTPEGEMLLHRGKMLSEEMESLFSVVKNEKTNLSGTLRISVSLAFSRMIVAPLLADFVVKYPDLKLHFHLSDGFTDLVENNIDLAIRIGSLEDSSLKAIRIGTSERRLYASKKYLKKFGVPKSLKDLKDHRCLYFSRLSSIPTWPLCDKGKPIQVQITPFMQADGSDMIREAAINGLGIALMPTWMVDGRDEAKEMQMVLGKHYPEATPIFAVTPFQKELGVKQRAVVEFLREVLK